MQSNTYSFELLKNTNVLFVEDDELTRTEIAQMLEYYFNRVYIAKCAAEALQLFSARQDIHVIITDVLMKEMDGLELIERLRQDNVDIPVLVITCAKTEELLMRAVTLKLTGYLLKPISLSTLKEGLLRCVKELVEGGFVFVPITKDIVFDPLNALLLVNNTPVELSKKEFLFLKYALSRRHALITKEEILEEVWEGEEVSEAAFKSLLMRLRQKIGKESIVAVKELGYKVVFHRR